MAKLGKFECGECGRPYLAAMHVHVKAMRRCPFCRAMTDYRLEDRRMEEAHDIFNHMKPMPESMPANGRCNHVQGGRKI